MALYEFGIVIDVGGTTTDAGVLVNQFPRESNKAANVGGVKTNFRMPDVIAIGLGGGTIVDSKKGNLKIGPQSVSYRITKDALCFGGTIYTLSDYAILKGKLQIPDTLSLDKISGKIEQKTSIKTSKLQQNIQQIISEKINYLIDKIKTDNKEVTPCTGWRWFSNTAR